MRDSFHYQARVEQFERQAKLALTEVERRGYLELVARYRKLAEQAAEPEAPAEATPAPEPAAP